jgi:hypothetical protein
MGISWLPEELLDFQEGLSSMEFVSLNLLDFKNEDEMWNVIWKKI